MNLTKMTLEHFRKFSNEQSVFFKSGDYANVDISKLSTLIVGQNNTGKSSIFKAIDILSQGEKFSSSDFNYQYIYEYINQQIKSMLQIKKNFLEAHGEDADDDNIDYDYTNLPYIKFEFYIDIPSLKHDNLANISKFIIMSSSLNEQALKAYIKILVEFKDSEKVKYWFRKIISNYTFTEDSDNEYIVKEKDSKAKREFTYNKFINHLTTQLSNLIDDLGLQAFYFNEIEQVDKIKFSDIFNFKLIPALSLSDEHILSNQFKSLINFHFGNTMISSTDNVDDNIKSLNEELNDILKETPSRFINTIMDAILTPGRTNLAMIGDLTFDKLLQYCVKCYYSENDFNIPENQYGLGYSKIISIVANLLDFIEKTPDDLENSKISLLAIEEPETFMHPQLQKVFIKNINNVLAKIIDTQSKNLNCQIAIATHSPYIVADKINEAVSLDNINYISLRNNTSSIKTLNDEIFSEKASFVFKKILKHMNLTIAEIFYADAAIIVEGFAEEKLLPYFISKKDSLKNKFISILNINGAHGAVFFKLLTELNIPAVILTDVDFKTSKNDTNQIKSYINQKTTNNTIIEAISTSNLSGLTGCQIDLTDNLKIFIQEIENGYCSTTFEEALILANDKNPIIQDAIYSIKRNTFYNHLGVHSKKDFDKLKNSNKSFAAKSKYLYHKFVRESKGDFTVKLIDLLYNSNAELNAPSYISKALDFIDRMVN